MKILHATSRGQVTLPKEWRDKYQSEYFQAEIQGDTMILTAIKPQDTFQKKVEDAWQEYKGGKVVEGDAIMKKYGL